MCDFIASSKRAKDIVEVAVVSKLNCVSAAVCCGDRLIADIQISGLQFEFYNLRHYACGSLPFHMETVY